MLANEIPAKFPLVWGADAGAPYIRAIPTASQIGIQNGAASLTDGFPPLTFDDEAVGGVPMFGQDVNGILNQLSAWSQWQNMGGPVSYDGTFSTSIGGYPKGAWILAAAGNGWWLSLVDNNTSDPDTGGANWQFLGFGQTYAGNPNGNVAGYAATQYGMAQALLWDTTNKILWLCTTTGTASTAVWTQLTGSSTGAYWCGTSGGTANAQTVTPPNSLQSLVDGDVITWQVGAGLNNTGSATLEIGSLGTFILHKQSPSGSVALTGYKELVAGTYASGMYDGTYIQMLTIAQGSAAQANASSNTGTLAAVTGSVTIGHVATFSDTSGTLQDGGVPGAATITYLTVANNNQTFGGGFYNADTSGGAFTINLLASPATGTCLDITDIAGTWGTANLTINNNGNTIMGQSAALICNRPGEDFKIWWNGSDWRLA